MTAFPDWRDNGGGGVTTNVLSLVGAQLKSIVDGVQSNTVTIPSGGATTNSLVNNGDNTLTSDVNGQSATADIILTATPTKLDINHIAIAVNGVGNTQVPVVETVSNSAALNQMSVAVNGITGTPAQIITIVDLSLSGSDLTAMVNGVTSPPLDLSTIIPPVTTNSLTNNGDNTLTSTVDGVASTDNIIDVVAIYKFINSFSIAVNGLVAGPNVVIDTVELDLTGNNLTVVVNGVASAPVDLSPIIPPTTTNTLVNNGNNTLTSTVDGVASTDNIIDTNGIARDSSNTISTQVNGLDSGPIDIIDTTALNLTGNLLKTTINSLDSNTVDIQVPIASPTNNNLVAMDATGHVKDAGVQVTTSTASNDNAHVPTSAAVQTNLALKANLVSPLFTGNPTAPTALTADNSTTLATTALVTSKIAAIPAAPTTNTFTNNISTNTMTSNVNGVSSSATLLSGVSATFQAPNSLQIQVNDFITSGLIIGSHTLSIVGTTLTDKVNGVSATAQVAPSAQSPTSSITFTNLDEIIILVAPSVNAIGVYTLQLKRVGQELNIVFSVNGNSNTGFNNSTIDIITVTDTTGNITKSNISNFILFRGYVRNTTPNSYFAVTFSMPSQLIYTNPLSMVLSQTGLSYLNENSTITSMITTDISNLVTLAAADLIFKMKVNILATSTSTPQGYVYGPGSSSAAIFQNSINIVTGAPTALAPASVATTAPYKLAATTLRNYLYNISNSNVFMWRIGSSGTLSALAPASVTAPNTPTGIAVDPTDRFVYVCSFGTGIFGQWSITKATGVLVPIASPPTAAAQMQDVTCHPSGKYLYAINNANGLVYQYSITQASGASQGALVALPTLTIASGNGPLKIIVHPNGLFAYVVNNNGGAGGTIAVFTINTTTGQLTLASTFTPASAGNLQGACISSNGLFILYTSQTSNLVASSSINQTTGAISALVSSSTVPGARDCCLDYSGAFLFVVNDTNNRIDGKLFNQTTGVLTNGSNVASGTNMNNIIAI